MLALFFRYFFLIFCSSYIYLQILNMKSQTKSFYLSIVLSNIITTWIIVSIPYTILIKILLALLISYVCLLTISPQNFILSINLLIISYGLSLVSYIFVNTLIGAVSYLIYKTPSSVPYTDAYLLIGIIQYLFIYFLLQKEQLRAGILLLIKKRYFTIATFSSGLFILCFAQVSDHTNVASFTKLCVDIILLLVSFLLLYYWRYRIKQTYIENMRRMERLAYENEIADKNKQIKALEHDNAELGQIIHKYRKVIPAIELSVTELLQDGATLNREELQSRAKELQTQLAEYRSESDNLFTKYHKSTVVTTQSGLHTVDAMLALMEKRAKQEWIRYKTQIDPDIRELTLQSIKEADLLHLLGDLIENAIHAVNKSEHKEILIHLGKLNDNLLLEISDSGVAFDVQTYQHLGNDPYTSHQTDGGSGTGLMDIWKLKKEYKISLYIYEYKENSNAYSKKISFLFDRKNHFLLKTYRDKEIKNALIRGDIHIFPHKNN